VEASVRCGSEGAHPVFGRVGECVWKRVCAVEARVRGVRCGNVNVEGVRCACGGVCAVRELCAWKGCAVCGRGE